MNASYEITVIYASHESDSPVPPLPEQSLHSDQLQVISVSETDPLHPWNQSLTHIKEALGAYTILLDSRDVFSKFFLEGMLSIAKKYGGAFIMPYLEFGRLKSQKELDKVLSKSIPTEDLSKPPDESKGSFRLKNKLLCVDTCEYPFIFPAELHGLLIPTGSLLQACNEVTNTGELEKSILLTLLKKEPVFYFQGYCSLAYMFPLEKDVHYDTRAFTKDWYFEPFEKFLLPALKQEKEMCGEISLFFQHMALYMVSIRFEANKDNKNKFILASEEVPALMDLYSDILAFVGTKTIIDNCFYPYFSSKTFNLLLLRLKKKNWHWFPGLKCSEDTIELTADDLTFSDLDNITLGISLIDYTDGCLEIDGNIADFFDNDSIEIYAQFGPDYYKLNYNQRYSLVKYFGVSFYRRKTFHISIPVPDPSVINKTESKEYLLNFYLKPNGQKEYRLNYSFSSHTSRFSTSLPATYWRFGNYDSFWDKKGIHVCEGKTFRRLKKEIHLWYEIFKKKNLRKYCPLKIINFLLRPFFSQRHIWLFMDKIYKGGDSSEYLYKYASSKNDGISKYYLLDQESSDYELLKQNGFKPLKRGSLKHKLIFLNADMVIASNSTVFSFNGYDTTSSQAIRGDIHFDVACVQHGMSVQKIAVAQQRLRDNIKLYFCASKYEIENLSKPVYDYKDYNILKLTGVPRYDGLINQAEKILLFSPTWRMNSALPPTQGESVARDYNPHFKETNYYRIYNSLINDPRLLSAAKEYGYRIQYILHPIISPQIDDFTKNNIVEIIPSIGGGPSYEKLFCNAALMVTDFSGVQFDFAYMRKPVVYFHHKDIPEHYEEGTFFYETMGFGEICHTNDELINVLCNYMKNDCKMNDEYRRRADDFFAFSDNNNCERIYPIMLDYEIKHHFKRRNKDDKRK